MTQYRIAKENLLDSHRKPFFFNLNHYRVRDLIVYVTDSVDSPRSRSATEQLQDGRFVQRSRIFRLSDSSVAGNNRRDERGLIESKLGMRSDRRKGREICQKSSQSEQVDECSLD